MNLYETIKKQFPLHFSVLRSLIFSKYAHQPKRSATPGYKQKCKALVNQFLALIRLRAPQHLVHWAMVGTMSMWAKGISLKHYRNPAMKAFSCRLETAFRYLNKIYDDTREKRNTFLQNQPIGHHSLDNFNQWLSFKTNRMNKAGVMLKGMVYNFVRAREYPNPKPVGTIFQDVVGQKWVVTSSRMLDHWTSEINVTHNTDSEKTCTVTLPKIGWSVVLFPNAATKQPLTYLDQELRPSLRMKVSALATNDDLILDGCFRSDSAENIINFSPRRHTEVMYRVRRMKEFLCSSKRAAD